MQHHTGSAQGGLDVIQHTIGGACGTSVVCAVRLTLDPFARPISRGRLYYTILDNIILNHIRYYTIYYNMTS